jgi:hypothetical protein
MVAREESRKPSSQKQRCDYPCLFVIVAYLHSSVRGFAKPRAVRLTCQYGYGSSASSFSLYVPFLLM